jgi:hypothetical protein
MNILAELPEIIGILEGILKLIEAIDPNAAQNPSVSKIESVLTKLKAII